MENKISESTDTVRIAGCLCRSEVYMIYENVYASHFHESDDYYSLHISTINNKPSAS
jgi:hypothetical protein